MNKIPEISIIIPVYNQEKYVDSCLKSILNQSFSDYEVIIVNDGSTDGGMTICRKYAGIDKRIIIIDKPNLGVTLARKDGTLNAKGKYLLYIDSDDVLPINSLQNLHSIADKYDLDLVIGNHERFFDNKRLLKQGKKPFAASVDKILKGDIFLQMILGLDSSGAQKSWGTYMWGRLYKREKVMIALQKNENVLFPDYTKGALIEDMAFNLAVAPFIESIWITNEVVYHYRYGGATSRDFPIIRKGGEYFDSRYDSCIKYNYDDMLTKVFKHYCSCLCLDIVFQLHFQKTQQTKIEEFIKREINERKVVLWRRNIKQNEDDIFNQAVLDNNSYKILQFCIQREKSMKKHYLMKKILFIYQRIIEVIST